MKKLIFILLIVILSGHSWAMSTSSNNEKMATAKKFKEVGRLEKQMKSTHQIPYQEIRPKIEEATKYFKKKD